MCFNVLLLTIILLLLYKKKYFMNEAVVYQSEHANFNFYEDHIIIIYVLTF